MNPTRPSLLVDDIWEERFDGQNRILSGDREVVGNLAGHVLRIHRVGKVLATRDGQVGHPLQQIRLIVDGVH